jgi:hypothetical protein
MGLSTFTLALHLDDGGQVVRGDRQEQAGGQDPDPYPRSQERPIGKKTRLRIRK